MRRLRSEATPKTARESSPYLDNSAPQTRLPAPAPSGLLPRISLMSNAPDHIRKFSSIVNDGPSRAGARSMLRPVGFKEEDFAKPVIGIASLWSMVTPCNMHLDKLAIEAE